MITLAAVMGRLCLFVIAILACGCDLVKSEICTTEARPAIKVSITTVSPDVSITDTLFVTAIDGTYSDSRTIVLSGPRKVGLAHERAGTYVVTITEKGQVQWEKSGVTVDRGECHVETATFDIAL